MNGNKHSRIKISFRVKVLFILLFMIIFPVFLSTPINSIFNREKDYGTDLTDQEAEIKLASTRPAKANYFNFCKNITVDSTKVSGSGNHLDFPLLISISDSDLHDDVQPDGDDIAFAIGISWLDHEIELFNQQYSATHANLIAWIRIPSLSTSVNTVITMYYGNSTINSQENPDGVWDTNYKGVYHLHDDFFDSTSNNRDGTNSGSSDATGRIGDGQDFEASDINDNINIGAWSVSGTEITMQAWVKFESFANSDARILSKNNGIDDYSNDHVWMLSTDYSISPNRLRGRIKTGTSDSTGTTTHTAPSGDVLLNTWHLTTLIYDGSNMRLILNGIPVDSYSKTGLLRINNWPIVIGNSPTLQSFTAIDGIVDEVRISSTVRSNAWLTTEYSNQNDPSTFYSIGAEQQVSINPPNSDYFNYYKIITIDQTQVSGSGSHINFPLLISLTDEDLRYDVQDDGDDIAFSANGKWLDHQIESFNKTFSATQAQLTAWVRVPFLYTNVDINITMYYSNITMGSRENPNEVWDSGYVGVWHLNTDPSGTIYDSTSPSSDGSSSGFMSSSDLVSGMIGGALDFDGNNDYVYFTNSPELQITGEITVQAWFKADSIGNDYLFNKMGGSGNRGWDVSFNTIDANFAWVEFRYSSDGTTMFNPGSVRVKIGEWCHVVGVYKPNEYHKLFVNGTLVKLGVTGIPPSQYDPPFNPRLAERADGSSTNYNGSVDEARISNVARSTDWIETEYKNQYNPNSFYSVGLEKNSKLVVYLAIEANAIDLYGNFVPNINISLVQGASVIDYGVTNVNGTILFTNVTEGSYNFTAEITSNIELITKIVNYTTQAILIDKGFQTINLICNLSSNFFEIIDIDGYPVESGWIIVGNDTNNLQNCTIDSSGKTTFHWLNTTRYEYNYTIEYQNNMYNPKIIRLASGNLTIANSTIQVQVNLTTVDFTILTLVDADAISGAKLIIKNNATGVSIVNLTSDLSGKAILRWFNSSGINGSYSIRIEFFGQDFQFNSTSGGPADAYEINLTVKNRGSIELRISINLDDFQTELVSLNPIDYILIEWGSELKLRVLFTVTKDGGLGLLGPKYADSIKYQMLLGSNLVQSGVLLEEKDNIGRHYIIVDTNTLQSDEIYIIKVSAQKSGFTLPSDLNMQLNVIKNNVELNQSENNDAAQSVYWSDYVNMSVKPYGKISEDFTIEENIFLDVGNNFRFSIPDVSTEWNLSRIVFNVYNVTFGADEGDINLTVTDDFSRKFVFNSSNSNYYYHNPIASNGSWINLEIPLNKGSVSGSNSFNFEIEGTFIDSIDIIVDTFFIRDAINVQYSKFNVSNSLAINAEIEGWAIRNITFEIYSCFYTSNWSKVDLSPLNNFFITTNEDFNYTLDSGLLGTGSLSINDRILYPLANQFFFTINYASNIVFDTIIKVEYIQEFYRSEFLETLNVSQIEKEISKSDVIQILPGDNNLIDNDAILWIKEIKNQSQYFLPSDLEMNVTIAGQKINISDYNIGIGFVLLESISKDQILQAFIETSQLVNLSLQLMVCYSRTEYYEIEGTVSYLIIEAPTVYGNIQIDPDLGVYFQKFDTSIIDANEYTVRFTISKNHYTTTFKDLDLIVQTRLTLINGFSEFFRKIENIFVKDVMNFTFFYTDAIKGNKITDLKTQYYIWESYDDEGNVTDNGQGDVISARNDAYLLDFETETRDVGDYLLILTLDKGNYDYKNAMILLTINKRNLDYTLGNNFKNNKINVIQGDTIPIEFNLTDPTKGNIPLINATIIFTIRNQKLEFTELGNGTYIFYYPTSSINTFFTSKTLVGNLNISKEDYNIVEFSITLVVEMEEIFPGFPLFYFILILSSIIAFAGSLIGYRIYKYSTLPTFVKKVRSIKKAIEGSKAVSESDLYRDKEVIVGELINYRWEKLGLSMSEIFGIKLEKKIKDLDFKKKISERIKVHDQKPLGLLLMKWDEKIGTELFAKYPEDVMVSEKTLMQVYSTHEYSGEKGVITLTAESLNILSYYTGQEEGYYLLLFLNLDDDPDVYEGGMPDILKIILENLKDDSYLQLIPQLFQRLSVYPSLSDEEILALHYQNSIKRTIINILREDGVITKSELMIWLKDKHIEGFFDLEAILNDLIKMEIIKVGSIKGIPSELIFLTKDLFMLRTPPIKLLENPVNYGLPAQFVKEYPKIVKEFFQDYQPTEEDNIKIIEALINPQVYEMFRLLRVSIATRQDLEKLKKKGVDDIYGVLKIFWDNKMIKVFHDEKNNEYYALLTDFYIDYIFPKYLLKIVKTAYEQKSKIDKVLLEYLHILEETYIESKSKK